ncbi:hypothetical protein B0H14DRAFT_3575978 [Mycena olivaceomarginata]|nr:hypothetical protein B0H14DRAFT_3575978 [Mycena olivaceomarginata]
MAASFCVKSVCSSTYNPCSSKQNIRMERGWRDVRKDTLQVYREIFLHLEELGLLDMESPIDRVSLFIVFQPRIQNSLNETLTSWNLHKIRTAKNKSHGNDGTRPKAKETG